MAGELNNVFSPITEMLQQISDLGAIYQIGFCIGAISQISTF
jgi:hypothetical protein